MTPQEAEDIFRLVEAKKKIQKARHTLPDSDEYIDQLHFIINMLHRCEEQIDEVLRNVQSSTAS